MPEDQPIACSLTQPELSRRFAEMAAVGDAALCEVRRTGTHAELLFAADVATRQRLEAIVAGEAECCPFLSLTLTEGGGAIVLEVEAPDGAEVVLSEIVEAFGGDDPTVAR